LPIWEPPNGSDSTTFVVTFTTAGSTTRMAWTTGSVFTSYRPAPGDGGAIVATGLDEPEAVPGAAVPVQAASPTVPAASSATMVLRPANEVFIASSPRSLADPDLTDHTNGGAAGGALRRRFLLRPCVGRAEM
jgi:hypothetical protein